MIRKTGLDSRAVTRVQASIIAAVIIIASVGGAYYYLTLPPPKKEILIGAAVSQTGPFGAAGKSILDGYTLWQKDVNARGGILGIPVRIVAYDDKSDPTTTKSLYERLITVDNVDFLLGPYSSSCGFAMAPVAEKYKMVALQPCNNAKKLYTQEGWEYQFLVFQIGISGGGKADSSIAIFDFLGSFGDQKPTTLAVINVADIFPRARAEGTLYWCEELDWIELVHHEEIEKGATDVTTVLSKVKAKNPEVLWFIGTFPEETLLVRTSNELGLKPKAIVVTTGVQLWTEYVEVMGKEGDYVIGQCSYDKRFPFPETAAFETLFTTEYGREPSNYEAWGYAAGTILEAAINGVGSWKNQEAIRDWLLNNEVKTCFGPWKVDKEIIESEGIKYAPVLTNYIYQIIDMYPEIVSPTEMATESPIYPIPD